jgi:hypothetical protein
MIGLHSFFLSQSSKKIAYCKNTRCVKQPIKKKIVFEERIIIIIILNLNRTKKFKYPYFLNIIVIKMTSLAITDI